MSGNSRQNREKTNPARQRTHGFYPYYLPVRTGQETHRGNGSLFPVHATSTPDCFPRIAGCSTREFYTTNYTVSSVRFPTVSSSISRVVLVVWEGIRPPAATAGVLTRTIQRHRSHSNSYTEDRQRIVKHECVQYSPQAIHSQQRRSTPKRPTPPRVPQARLARRATCKQTPHVRIKR